jgi:DNA invertase Pin-like site-specific DNA recombinase
VIKFSLLSSVKKVSKRIKVNLRRLRTAFLTIWQYMRIGYARASTQEQNLDLQKDALRRTGCKKIIEDVASGKTENRAGLDHVRELLREGDVIVVWRLDRLGRSLNHLIGVISDLEKQKIGFQSLQESIDTTTPNGRLVFHIFGALAEFERNLIRGRTRAGLEAARARGRKGGRPKKLSAKERALRLNFTIRRRAVLTKFARRSRFPSQRFMLMSEARNLRILHDNVLYHSLFELASPRRVLRALGR